MPLGLPTIDEGRSAGRHLGSTYPDIWEPDWLVLYNVGQRTSDWLGSSRRRRSTTQRIWLGLMAISVVLVSTSAAIVFGLATLVPKSELPLRDPVPANLAAFLGITGIISLLISVIGNSLARTRAERLRSRLREQLPSVVLEQAIEEVRVRRAREREHADPRPPLSSPLGVSDAERVEFAAQWLRYFGVDVEVDMRAASGANIHAERLVVCVVQEHEDAKTAMRDIASLAKDSARTATAFLNELPAETLLDAARAAKLAVFVMAPEDGSLFALSDEASEILRGARADPITQH